MYLDQTLIFSSAQAITADAASTGVVDLTGAGVGNAPAISHGTSTVFGADMGVGDGMAVPKILVGVATTFLTCTSIDIQFQCAVDDGTNNPGSWVTYLTQPGILLASLVAGNNLGNFDLPKMPEKVDGVIAQYPLPRFIRLNYVVNGSDATAGALNAAIVIQRDGQLAGVKYPSAFSVKA